MNWGKGIVLSFVLFAIFIGVLVFICVRQEVSLVSPDYYKQELDYQRQIDRIQNTNELQEQPTMLVVGRSLEIRFSMLANIQAGEVKLFRPSDTRFDKSFALPQSQEPVQSMDISDMPTGMYHARMKWSMNGKEYYLEKTITL